MWESGGMELASQQSPAQQPATGNRAFRLAHWVSDTVGGSLLGYALGHLAWEARRDARLGKNGASLVVSADKVSVKWTLD